MMQLNLSMHRSRENVNWDIVYVDYLSVAPWNRASIVKHPKYRTIGAVLLGQAVGVSIEEGFKGRIGLHSLSAAKGWYEKWNMKSYGPDNDVEGLEYFEMNEQDAKKFLNKLAGNIN